MAEMGKLIEELTKSGVLLATEGCLPSARWARASASPQESFAVTDGPFTESKEIIGGFAHDPGQRRSRRRSRSPSASSKWRATASPRFARFTTRS
jgi:hypothetical protein